MCGTLKQEVDTEEEEAAPFDNTKWCKDTTKCDTCRARTHMQITHADNIFSKNKTEGKQHSEYRVTWRYFDIKYTQKDTIQTCPVWQMRITR